MCKFVVCNTYSSLKKKHTFPQQKTQTQCVPLTHCIFFYPRFLSFFISLSVYTCYYHSYPQPPPSLPSTSSSTTASSSTSSTTLSINNRKSRSISSLSPLRPRSSSFSVVLKTIYDGIRLQNLYTLLPQQHNGTNNQDKDQFEHQRGKNKKKKIIQTKKKT